MGVQTEHRQETDCDTKSFCEMVRLISGGISSF